MRGGALIKFWLDKRVSQKRSAGFSAVISLILFTVCYAGVTRMDTVRCLIGVF
jgi:hypothetical protein